MKKGYQKEMDWNSNQIQDLTKSVPSLLLHHLQYMACLFACHFHSVAHSHRSAGVFFSSYSSSDLVEDKAGI
jgi:hypothetical protein